MTDEAAGMRSALHKSFGDHVVLDGVDIAVPRETTLVILGRSGTSKSVLLKILIGLLNPTAGDAEILGMRLPICRKERLAARARIGYVFQGGALFDSLSVLDNVNLSISVGDDATIEERARERWEWLVLPAAERTP